MDKVAGPPPVAAALGRLGDGRVHVGLETEAELLAGPTPVGHAVGRPRPAPRPRRQKKVAVGDADGLAVGQVRPPAQDGPVRGRRVPAATPVAPRPGLDVGVEGRQVGEEVHVDVEEPEAGVAAAGQGTVPPVGLAVGQVTPQANVEVEGVPRPGRAAPRPLPVERPRVVAVDVGGEESFLVVRVETGRPREPGRRPRLDGRTVEAKAAPREETALVVAQVEGRRGRPPVAPAPANAAPPFETRPPLSVEVAAPGPTGRRLVGHDAVFTLPASFFRRRRPDAVTRPRPPPQHATAQTEMAMETTGEVVALETKLPAYTGVAIRVDEGPDEETSDVITTPPDRPTPVGGVASVVVEPVGPAPAVAVDERLGLAGQAVLAAHQPEGAAAPVVRPGLPQGRVRGRQTHVDLRWCLFSAHDGAEDL